MSSKFKRKIEDFVCENCGKSVNGDGYTNHCPFCLWSRHVDIFPGDRALLDKNSDKQTCGGMMRPIGIEQEKGEWSLIHKCQKCGKENKNKISKKDNFEEVIKISFK